MGEILGDDLELRQIKALSTAFRESVKAEVTEEIKAEIKEGLTWVPQNSPLDEWARRDSNPRPSGFPVLAYEPDALTWLSYGPQYYR